MEKSNLLKRREVRSNRASKRRRDENGRFILIHPFFKKEKPSLDDLLQSTYIDNELG